MKQSFKFLIAFSLFFGSFSYAAYASNAAKANKNEGGVSGEKVTKTFERSPRPRPGRAVSPGRNSGNNRRVSPNRPRSNRRVAPSRPSSSRRVSPSRPNNNRRVAPPRRGGSGNSRVNPPRRGGNGRVAPPRRGGNGRVAPPRRGGNGRVAPPRRGGNGRVTPPRRGGSGNSRVNPPRRGGNGRVAPPRRGGNGRVRPGRRLNYRPKPPLPPRRYRPITGRRFQKRHMKYHRRFYHRPGWHRPRPIFRRYVHVPYRYYPSHRLRFVYPRYYFRTIPYRFVYWNRWVRFRIDYNNGYYFRNGYPYFVYNGYLHRYSSYDTCNFELVDGYRNATVERFNNYRCNVGYDQCAELRSRLNYQEGSYRYFCSEAIENVRSNDYDWDYDDDFYSDVDYDDYDEGPYFEDADFALSSGSDSEDWIDSLVDDEEDLI